MKKFIERFIYPKDKLHPDTLRKGRIFLVSFIVMFIIGLFGEIYILAFGWNDYDLGAILGNGLMTVFAAAAFPIYKRFGLRVLLVNIVSALGYMSNFGTYNVTGGIYSSDIAFGISVCCWIFLVGDKISGLVWFGITLCTILFFGYAEAQGWRNFGQDALAQTFVYPTVNYFLTTVFIAFIIWMHERSKESYLKELDESKSDLEKKSKELEVKNEDITASINYARRIQYAVLPQMATISRSIPEAFILYRPKDIVSGDFFWFHELDADNYIIVCADCTGHGVPGAMMTVICSSLLNQVVIDNKQHSPSKILQETDRLISVMLKQQQAHEHFVQDGMDLSLLKVDKRNREIIFTSAKRPGLLFSGNAMQELKGSKFSLGGMVSGEKTFTEHRLSYAPGDEIFLYTDGYTDQFGGPRGKKFSSRQLRELISQVHALPMKEQQLRLEEKLAAWQGANEQVDDILLMGIRF